MLQVARAVIHEGKIELLEPLNLPEGTKIIVTALIEENNESQFWLNASTSSLDKIWNNDQDDIYSKLLDA